MWCLNKDDGSVVFQIHAHHSEVVGGCKTL